MEFRVKRYSHKKTKLLPFLKKHPISKNLNKTRTIPTKTAVKTSVKTAVETSVKTPIKTWSEYLTRSPVLQKSPCSSDSSPCSSDSSCKKLKISLPNSSSENSRIPKMKAITAPSKIKYRQVKIIFLVLNCKKNNYRRKKQKWLKTLPSNFNFFHIQGDTSLSVSYKLDKSNNLITIHCDDSYLGIPFKVLTAMKIINHHCEYDYIFKINDNIIWDNFSYLRLIQKNLAENPVHYGGVEAVRIIKKQPHYKHLFYNINSCNTIYLNPTSYYSGNFYILNRNAVNILLKIPEIEDKEIEDHAIGQTMCKVSQYFKNFHMKTLRMGNELPYHCNLESMGFYFNKNLKKIIKYNKLSFCIFNNKRLLDNIEIFKKSNKSSCFFIHSVMKSKLNGILCNKMINSFSQFEKKNWWDVIYFVDWDQQTIQKNKMFSMKKEHALMERYGFYRTHFSKITNPSCNFILSKFGIKNMKDYLLNNIFVENMSKLKVFVMSPLF